MRLALLIYGSLDTVSGGYLYDRQLVAHLRAAGDDVELISLPWRHYGRHLLDNFNAGLRRRLADGRWDILLQDELNHPSLFALNPWLKRRVPYRIISIVHHLRGSEARPAWQNVFYRAVERAYLRGVDGFLFNSQTTRAVVASLLPPSSLTLKPSLVAYPAADQRGPALDPAVIAARAGAPGPLRVLFLGNLIARKGLHMLVDALAQAPAGWHLTVVGDPAVDPAYARAVHAQTARLGLTERIAWLGRLTDAQVRAQLETHDVLAVPSSYEGFGIVYLEALACGLPVLATTAGAAPELITPGVDGWLVPPADPAGLAAALQTVTTNRGRLAAMSLAARARYQRHPPWAASLAAARTFLQAARPAPV